MPGGRRPGRVAALTALVAALGIAGVVSIALVLPGRAEDAGRAAAGGTRYADTTTLAAAIGCRRGALVAGSHAMIGMADPRLRWYTHDMASCSPDLWLYTFVSDAAQRAWLSRAQPRAVRVVGPGWVVSTGSREQAEQVRRKIGGELQMTSPTR